MWMTIGGTHPLALTLQDNPTAAVPRGCWYRPFLFRPPCTFARYSQS